MRYYYCVNCGLYHDLKEERQRGVVCRDCGYDDVCEYDKEEWLEAGAIRPWILVGKTHEEYTGIKSTHTPKVKNDVKIEKPTRTRRTKSQMALDELAEETEKLGIEYK